MVSEMKKKRREGIGDKNREEVVLEIRLEKRGYWR